MSKRMDVQGWCLMVDFWHKMANEEFLKEWPPSKLYRVYEENRRFAFREAARVGLGLRTIEPGFKP